MRHESTLLREWAHAAHAFPLPLPPASRARHRSKMNVLRAALLSVACAVASANYECPTAPTAPEDRRPQRETLRIAQYNVEWLFLEQYNDCPGNGCSWADEEQAAADEDAATATP